MKFRNPVVNIILNTDSYKLTQFRQDPPNMTHKFSYIEARGTDLEYVDARTVFIGMQGLIKNYLSVRITHKDIDEAKPLVEAHGYEFNEEGWRYIVNQYDGYLPLRIKAVREGTVVPLSNILASVESTDPKCGWLVSYVETLLLRAIWYPTTVASNGLRAKQIIKDYMDETADYAPDELDFKLHDFGARGVSSQESAMIGGAAHLVNFKGTDTIAGTLYAMDTYGGDMPGFSINASEHSSITPWGKENEEKAFKNMIEQFGGEGKIFACVSDSYDIENATKVLWGQHLKKDIEEMGGTLVVRPDSGDPMTVPIDVVKWLMDAFGYTVNSKGFKILPDHVRVIQGDGITVDSMKQILENMKQEKLSANNIAFGMGAGTLQLVSRDTYKFAMKCSAVMLNNQWEDVWKESPGKPSKRGRLTLVQNVVTKEFKTIRVTDSIEYEWTNVMHTFYDNGPFDFMYTNFINVRSEAWKGLK